MPATIAEDVISCLGSFKSIASALHADSQNQDRSKKPEWKITDELSRFEAWCGNTGAHQRDQRSLDYRLRDASHLVSQVRSLLGDMKGSLEDAYSILDGTKTPWDQEVPDEEDDDDESKSSLEADDIGFSTEMDQISADVAEVIDCLMNLSVSIQHPAPHDRLCGWTDTGNSLNEPTDIAHIQAIFEDADPRLATLLGKANIRRRQYFKHRELQHQKLLRTSDKNPNTSRSNSEQNDPLVTSGPDTLEAERFSFTNTRFDSDELSVSGFTQTSDASSSIKDELLRFPALPRRSTDGTLQCPFCFMIISATTSSAWQKHVLADLRPYCCIAVDCPVAGTEFEGRHEWMEHMLQSHCLEWRCVFCVHEPFPSTSCLRDHLCRQHRSVVSTSEIETTISFCEMPKPFDVATKCPLCRDSLESVEIYRRHVGRHLEAIALFVLPHIEVKYLGDQNETGSNIETDADYSYTERKEMKMEGNSMGGGVIRGYTEDSRGGGHIQPEHLSNDSGDGSQRDSYPLSDNGATDSTVMRELQVGNTNELRDAKSTSPQDRTAPPSRDAIPSTVNPMALSQQGGYSLNSKGVNLRVERSSSTLSPTSNIPDKFVKRNTTQADLTSRIETDTGDSLTRDYFASTKSAKGMAPQQDAEHVDRNSSNKERGDEARHENAKDYNVAKLPLITTLRAETKHPEGKKHTVRFRESNSSDHYSPRSRDSGLGSSNKTTIGGRSDRYFTAQDYDNQRFSVDALREALDSVHEEKRRYKSKATDLDAQLAASKSAIREKELEIRKLKEDKATLARERDSFEVEVKELRRRLIRGDGSDESSDNLSGRKSKLQESQEHSRSLLERINTVNPAFTSSDRDITRRHRSSVNPRVPFTRELLADDRIERGPPLTTGGFDRFENNYSTSPTIRAEAGSVSSSRNSISSMNTFNTAISGDYVPEPLPTKPQTESKSASSRKHRHQ